MDNSIIDYSLLIGVHTLNNGPMSMNSDISWTEDIHSFFENDQGGMFDYEERNIYFIGIIDFLT